MYPVLFTVSSSLTLSSSLAATSVIPFTEEKDVSTGICTTCFGTGKEVDTKKVIKVRDLETLVPNEALRNKVLESLTVGDPYLGVDLATGDAFDITLNRGDAPIATVRVKSTFLQDELATAPEKCQNKKLIYTTYTASPCQACEIKDEKGNGTGYANGLRTCRVCGGEGYINKQNAEGSDGSYYVEICKACDGKGTEARLNTAFKFKKPSLYQFRKLLTDADKEVDSKGTQNTGKKILGTNYKHWYLNTLIIAVLNTIITVFICTTAGYIFSRFEFAGRKQIMAGMIILQMFPSFIGMVATYVILWKFNALNTLWGLVLVYSAGSIPFNAQLMKGYFDTMPKDIAEAAYIDGATPLGAYLRVILPAAKPQLVFLTLTSFTGPWMDYIFPRLILRSDDKKTLAVGLYEMISGRSNDNFTMFAAGAILVAVPFALIFMAGQKSLLMSLAGTSGKE